MNELTCLHCGGPKKPPPYFLCSDCWEQLPERYRAAYGTLKIKCLLWLRLRAPERKLIAIPRPKFNED